MSAEQAPPSLGLSGSGHARYPSQSLRLLQWNVSALKRETYKVIRKQRPHIIFVQETRQEVRSTPAYNYINRTRDNPTRGGGVAIGIDKNLTFRD